MSRHTHRSLLCHRLSAGKTPAVLLPLPLWAVSRFSLETKKESDQIKTSKERFVIITKRADRNKHPAINQTSCGKTVWWPLCGCSFVTAASGRVFLAKTSHYSSLKYTRAAEIISRLLCENIAQQKSNTHTHACMHACMHACTHTRTHAHTHAHTRTHIHTHIHAHIQMHTHT